MWVLFIIVIDYGDTGRTVLDFKSSSQTFSSQDSCNAAGTAIAEEIEPTLERIDEISRDRKDVGEIYFVPELNLHFVCTKQ